MMTLGAASLISYETLALLVGLLFLIRYFIHRKWRYFAEKGIPYETPSLKKLGNIIDTFGKAFTIDGYRKQKFGNIYGEFSMFNPSIVVHDLDIMRQIYTKEFKNFPDRQAFLLKMNGKDMNHGLTVLSDNKWKRVRSALSPTFSISKLKLMHSILDGCTSQTVNVLQKKCDECNGKFVPKIVFSNLSLDVITLTALGTNCNVQTLDGTDTEIALMVRNSFITGLTGKLVLSCIVFPPLERIYEKLGLSMFPSESLAYMRKLIVAVIERRKTKDEKSKDLLQLMLDAEVPDTDITNDSLKGLGRDEIIGNAMLMVGAGYENTANTMTFLAYNLAFHPDAQSKLQEEIDEVRKEKGVFDYDSVNKMKYLDMCINETLRLYCPVIANSRICQNETTINGLTIPKGCQVKIPMFALAHDPEYWDEPWEFRPERMEDMSQINPMVFQPFGAGPRNCIGLRFAVMEIKLAMCKVLEKFTIKPCDDTPKPPLELTLVLGIRPKVEFSLQAVPR